MTHHTDYDPSPYLERDRTLREMGFNSYDAYLTSPLWYAIRRFVMVREQNKCQCCVRDARVVHHAKYDRATLEGRTIRWLVALCSDCHETAEFDNQKKRPLDKANGVIWELGRARRTSLGFKRNTAIQKRREKYNSKVANLATRGVLIGSIRPPHSSWKRARRNYESLQGSIKLPKRCTD